ncbi:uncharacterized protein LOC117328886 [Pecten maximus]|uniref:uncharacterized protein LOC117328886 n=1 Tax=Pecten maximus TaxID=6579 RepID=UPI0014591078|nr:uncharacterized protein LOC117328886 [Pecten maximus]
MAYPKFGFFFVHSDYYYSKTSSILPAIFVTPKGFNPTNDSYMFHQKFLGCLATLVDLMMPAFLSETVMIRKQYESESTQILSAIEMAMIRVKRALKMRLGPKAS